MDAIRGIGFDLDHTLAIDNHLERVSFLRLLQSVASRGGRSLGTLADEIDAVDRLLARQRSGEFTIDEAVRLFVAEHGLTSGDGFVEAFRKMAVESVEEFVVPLPGVDQTMEELEKRGILVAVLTNGWDPLQKRKAEQAGFRGPVLVCSEIGERKPATIAFERLLHALGTEPRQTCYVGDDPRDDIAGAQDAGLQAVWIDWEGRAYPDDLPPPAHTIHTLVELLAVVPQCARAS
ncbi:MAG: HAD family hydrolase [Candidatus Cybelea sp.]